MVYNHRNSLLFLVISTPLAFIVRPAFAVVPAFLLAFALCAVFAMVTYAIPSLFTRSRDPYGLFHLSLNKLPGEDPSRTPSTEWLNMGYWKDADSFPTACEDLALKLVTAAGCIANGNVLDVGHGTGDSLILQLTSPSVPRPARLTGITSLRTHHERSLDRLRWLHSSQPDTRSVDIILHHGDAVYHPSVINHPLDPTSKLPAYTSILALDCAYHFKTRQEFLRQALERLGPGGKIALADITFTDEALAAPSLVTKVLMWCLMQKANRITTDRYVEDMRKIGYVDVFVEDITPCVFPGFRGFLMSRGWMWAAFGRIIGLSHARGLQFVIVRGSRVSSI